MTIIIIILVETKTCHFHRVYRDDNDGFFSHSSTNIDATQKYNDIRFLHRSISS